MRTTPFKLQGRVWIYPGDIWHFVTIEGEDAEEIKRFDMGLRRGFGSIPVMVTVGETTWKTSVFPQKGGNYVLPLKKDIRKKENIKAEEILHFSLEVLSF